MTHENGHHSISQFHHARHTIHLSQQMFNMPHEILAICTSQIHMYIYLIMYDLSDTQNPLIHFPSLPALLYPITSLSTHTLSYFSHLVSLSLISPLYSPPLSSLITLLHSLSSLFSLSTLPYLHSLPSFPYLPALLSLLHSFSSISIIPYLPCLPI